MRGALLRIGALAGVVVTAHNDGTALVADLERIVYGKAETSPDGGSDGGTGEK
jgi:hypothetical protein